MWHVDQNTNTAKDIVVCGGKFRIPLLSDNGGTEATSPPQTDGGRVWYVCKTALLLSLLHVHVRGCNAVSAHNWRALSNFLQSSMRNASWDISAEPGLLL
jgi:hypothetical protein